MSNWLTGNVQLILWFFFVSYWLATINLSSVWWGPGEGSSGEMLRSAPLLSLTPLPLFQQFFPSSIHSNRHTHTHTHTHIHTHTLVQLRFSNANKKQENDLGAFVQVRIIERINDQELRNFCAETTKENQQKKINKTKIQPNNQKPNISKIKSSSQHQLDLISIAIFFVIIFSCSSSSFVFFWASGDNWWPALLICTIGQETASFDFVRSTPPYPTKNKKTNLNKQSTGQKLDLTRSQT